MSILSRLANPLRPMLSPAFSASDDLDALGRRVQEALLEAIDESEDVDDRRRYGWSVPVFRTPDDLDYNYDRVPVSEIYPYGNVYVVQISDDDRDIEYEVEAHPLMDAQQIRDAVWNEIEQWASAGHAVAAERAAERSHFGGGGRY